MPLIRIYHPNPRTFTDAKERKAFSDDVCDSSGFLYFVLSPVLTDEEERHISSTPTLKIKLATLLYSKGPNSFL
jgi:hypothetical protein